MEAVISDTFARIAARLAPGATVLRAWPLRGGISAHMTALELALPTGATRRVILRRPGRWAEGRPGAADPAAAMREHRLLQIVHAAGIPAPAPLLLDASGEILPDPYLVLDYIDGEVVHSPADARAFARQMAVELAHIHRIDGRRPELAGLPQENQWLARGRVERPVEEDEEQRPREIRALLRSAGYPLPHPNPPVLVHGDPWPGNILWRAGRLAALIDWEESHIGDPLEDLSIARFDVLCMLGREGMEELTASYRQARPQVDFADLPYWDLYAALRPIGEFAAWAGGWADLGRPDVTEPVLRAYHHQFVAQALIHLP